MGLISTQIFTSELILWLRIESGVRQACVWSPLLFCIMVDFVLRESCDRPSAGLCMRERRRTLFGIEQAWHLTGLDYADDVTLLESGSERGQQALYALQRAGEEVGLAISKSKTKTLGFGETEPVINLDGEIVEVVNHFRYLDSEVMSSGRLDKELRTRIGRAPATFGEGGTSPFPYQTPLVRPARFQSSTDREPGTG